MGYPRSFPRVVAYAPKDYGGVGLRLFGTEQGLHKILQIIKHIRTNTSIGKVYGIVIQNYQLMSGLSQPVLQDTRTLPWSNAPWIDTTRQFLHTTQSAVLLNNPWITTTRRQHDRHIMDDILGLNLPKQHAIQLQSVRLYLRVTVLSEITDASGLSLLPTTFKRPNPRYNEMRDDTTSSTLRWPNQPSPGPNAWKRWKEIISWLYLDSATNQLNTPLGLWKQEYDTDYKWNWLVCPISKTLFQKHGHQWYAYLPQETHHDRITYRNQASLTSTPQNTVPATPTITTQNIHLRLPIYGLLKPIPRPPNQKSLQQRLLIPPEPWAEPLWHDVRPHAHIDTLRAQILNTTRIILVTDAAVQPDGKGTCAWTIWSNTELWSGEGYVPGTSKDMYSGLAEAYGLYTVLSFFQQYCQYYPELLQRPCTIHAYCDNQGVIDRTSRPSIYSYPRDAISDDYPIYAELKQTIEALRPIQVALHHVKGHQDTKSDKPLTLPEKLNIDCDARASKMEPQSEYMNIHEHPATTAAYPHLTIKNQIIIRRIQHALREAAQTPEYFEYLGNKFNWPAPATTQVQWSIFQLAITRLRKTENRFITKYVHEWLPLQDRYHVKSLSIDQLCPSCRSGKEMAQHFLACPHPDRQKVWTELHQNIQKHSIKNNICSELYNLIEYGLYHGRSIQPPFRLIVTPTTQQTHQGQSQLGWQQLYYGRYSPRWMELCTGLHPNTNGTHYFAKIINLTWQAAIGIWSIRNKHLHPSNPTEADRTQLQDTVRQIFHDVQHEPHLHEALQYTSPEQIMTKPTRQIRQWINNCHNHISNQRKAAKIRAKLRNTDIRQYFPRAPPAQPKTTDKNLLRPP